eukprot:9507069-Lingulodinium_polyedra.AAC.1
MAAYVFLVLRTVGLATEPVQLRGRVPPRAPGCVVYKIYVVFCRAVSAGLPGGVEGRSVSAVGPGALSK